MAQIHIPQGFERKTNGGNDSNMPKFTNTNDSQNFVCEVLGARYIEDSHNGRDFRYFEINFDIAEGEDQGIYARRKAYYDEQGTEKAWGGSMRLYIPDDGDTKAYERFNKNLDCFVDAAGEQIDFRWNSTDFVKSYVGVKFQATEYSFETDDGVKTGFWLKPKFLCSVERVRNGKEKVLDRKLLENGAEKYEPMFTEKPTKALKEKVADFNLDESLPF